MTWRLITIFIIIKASNVIFVVKQFSSEMDNLSIVT